MQNLHSLIKELYSVRSREELEKVPQVLYSVYGCAFFAAYFRRCTDFRGWSFSYPCCKWLTDGTDLEEFANDRLYMFLEAAASNGSGAREYLNSVVRTQMGSWEILNLRAAAFGAQATDQSLSPLGTPQSYTSVPDTASGSNTISGDGVDPLSSLFYERPESMGVVLGAASTADVQAPPTAVYPYSDSDLDRRHTDHTNASLPEDHHTIVFPETSALHGMEMSSYIPTSERNQNPFQAPTCAASAPRSDQDESTTVPSFEALAAHNESGLYGTNQASTRNRLATAHGPALGAFHASNRTRFKPYGTKSRISPARRLQSRALSAESARRTAMRLDRCLRNVGG